MKNILIALSLVFLSSCFTGSSYQKYSGTAPAPFLSVDSRCYPEQVHPMVNGMFLRTRCNRLVMITNPFDVEILADFDVGLYEYRKEPIPPRTTRSFIGGSGAYPGRLIDWHVPAYGL